MTLGGILDVAKFHSQNQNQETKRSGRHWHIKPTAIFLALHFFLLFIEGNTNYLCHIFSNAEEMLCLM